jgi:AraC-like DNA-binding protein
VVVGTIGSHRKAISFLTKSQDMTYCGQQVVPGSIIVQRRELQHRRNPVDRHWGSMSLTHEDFRAACMAITGREFPDEAFRFVVQPSPDVMSRFLRMHESVELIAKTVPDIFAMPEVGHSLEQQLIHLMVRCLTDGISPTITVGARRHDKIVAQLEKLLEAKADQPLYLAEICAAIGVAERTLRSVCEEHLGMGPIRYLTLRRMHLVRRALLRADPSKATVTQIVTDYGFWELGRFSVAYHRLFGETPSASLRKSSDYHHAIKAAPLSFATFDFA